MDQIMQQRTQFGGFVILCALAFGLHGEAKTSKEANHDEAIAEFKRLPLGFEWNSGQVDPAVKAFARGSGYALFLTANQAVVSLTRDRGRRAVVRWTPLHANPHPAIRPLDPLPGKINYKIGNDPKRWRKDIIPFGRIQYSNVYPGIDLVYYGHQDQLEYDYRVAPGADPRSIEFSIEGARRLHLNKSGDLVIDTAAGSISHHKPNVYQEIGGARQEIAGRFILESGNRVRFAIGDYDKTAPLVVDPALSYSTYLGGTGTDRALAVAVDSIGDAYVGGTTSSVDFPVTTNAPYPAALGGMDGFITVYLLGVGKGIFISTYLGGTGDDEVDTIQLSPAFPPDVYIAGTTTSTDFPLHGAIQTHNAGGKDAFIARLVFPSDIFFSTYYGGSGDDIVTGMGIDELGNVIICGKTNSTDLPTLAPIQASNAGGFDAFVAKVSNVGAPLYFATYLGGAYDDAAYGMGVDANGIVYLAGGTNSSNFGNPSQSGNLWPSQGFVAAMNTVTSTSIYTKLFGGNGTTVAKAIAVDGAGHAAVTGYTNSATFPVSPNAFQKTYGGGTYDAFLSIFTPTGAWAYTTYFGGSGVDMASSVGIDSKGNVVIAGGTSSTNLTLQAPTQAANGGGTADGFLTKFNAGYTSLAFSTYIGGSGADTILAMRIGSKGNATFVGTTDSTNFPMQGSSVQTTNQGNTDAFLAKISLK